MSTQQKLKSCRFYITSFELLLPAGTSRKGTVYLFSERASWREGNERYKKCPVVPSTRDVREASCCMAYRVVYYFRKHSAKQIRKTTLGIWTTKAPKFGPFKLQILELLLPAGTLRKGTVYLFSERASWREGNERYKKCPVVPRTRDAREASLPRWHVVRLSLKKSVLD